MVVVQTLQVVVEVVEQLVLEDLLILLVDQVLVEQEHLTILQTTVHLTLVVVAELIQVQLELEELVVVELVVILVQQQSLEDVIQVAVAVELDQVILVEQVDQESL
jgi:hypothetical protein